MRSAVAYLISESYTQNAYGVMVKNTERKKVFVKVTSVSSQEWFEGGRNGLNPQFRFTIFAFDYNKEAIIEFDGIQYTIYRTYINGDNIDLYVEKRKGNE